VKITRSTRDRVRLRRAGIVLASVQGRPANEIAVMFAATENYVREVIHAFHEKGFAALDPKWSGSRPTKFGPAARDLICRIARATPSAVGQPFTTWSLTRLVSYLREHHRLIVSTETTRRVLRKAGITWQRTKTWKISRDPDFAAKMVRILDLYDHPPADGRVRCVDEFGPLNLQPRPGHGWFRRGQPARRRATYTRTHGVRQMLAALDLATGQMFYRFRDRKTLATVPRLLQTDPPPLPRREALPGLRQLRPTRQGRSRPMVCWSRHRAGLHAHQRLLAELDRVRVHGTALLHPRRQRLPLSRCSGSRDRWLCPLAQPALPPEAAPRGRLEDPPPGLPTQRCVTRH
jgi:transposase